MCSHYLPLREENLARFRHEFFPLSYDAECYPGRSAPFIANSDPDRWQLGTFGLMPHWAKPDLARRTYNARSETVGALPSFKNAWRRRQLAVIPVEAIFEPNYESGRAVRWRIEREDGQPFGLAGVWEQRRADDGSVQRSFSMLTINADEHPLMQRFHQPGKEKRSIVVLADEDWSAWLEAREEDEVRGFLRLFDPGMMQAEADPAKARTRLETGGL